MSTRSLKSKVEVLMVRNVSVLPDSVRGLFPDTGYLYLKSDKGGYEVWQSSFNEDDEDIFRERVTVDVGNNMVRSVKEWNKVALELEVSQRKRKEQEKVMLRSVLSSLPEKVAGFDRIYDELFDDNGKLVYIITVDDLKMENFKLMEDKIYRIVFGIDSLEF